MAFYDPIRVRRLLTRPTGELTRAQLALRWSVDLAWHCAHELRADRASQMAAALTYRTIFGLVPFFVLSLIVFNAFGGFQSVGSDLRTKIYGYLGISPIAVTQDGQGAGETDGAPPTLTQVEVNPDQPPAAAGADDDGATSTKQVANSVEKHLNDLQQKVAGVSFASIGIVGLAILIWAALSLLVTVEQCFNRIYNCMTGRGWHLRIAIYWAVITLGPVLLTVSLYITTQAVEQAQQWLGAGPIGEEAGRWFGSGLVGAVTATGASWLLLFLMYSLMPNTTVRLRPALIGSLVAAILWEFAKGGFKLYLVKAVGYSKLYGGLGLIPLFLFWVYLTWLIVLFGLELTYTLQAMRGRKFKSQPKTDDRDSVFDPRWVIPIMAALGEAFDSGKSLTVTQMARRMSLPVRAVSRLGEQLLQAGLLHRIEADKDGNPGYTLAQPPDRITVNRLLKIANGLSLDSEAAERLPGAHVLADLNRAEQHAAKDRTLAEVVAPGDGTVGP